MGQQEKAVTGRIVVVVLTSVKSTCPVKAVANSSTSSASGETRSTGSQGATEEEEEASMDASMDASRAATAADMVCRLQEEGSMLVKESRIWVWVPEILAFPMDVVTKLQDMELVLVWVTITEARTT
jgi:hypothetical protein